MTLASRALVFAVFFSFTVALAISWTSDMTWFTWFRAIHRDRSWKGIVAAKVQADMAKIPKKWILEADVLENATSRSCIAGEFIESLLDDETRRITAMDDPELVQNMEDGSLSAVQTVRGFGKRAAYAHQLVSFCTILRNPGPPF